MRSEELGGVVVAVERAEADVPVLAPRHELAAVRGEAHRVDGPEVPTHGPELLLVDLVEEGALELARAPRRGRHGRSVLPAADEHVVEDGRDGR